ncbi:hypothetical protein ABZT03_40990 [Streptomyces sp. NPDC005574]|uniref:hypothetical protein n=1 Tax=Streptomyces sp. NPDC005574 TaxID=3156891 RepID=UPI0033A2E257
MSTQRRPLATDPSTTKSTPLTDMNPRLLAAERAIPDAAVEGALEHRDVAGPKGRRTLGPGVAGTIEAVS